MVGSGTDHHMEGKNLGVCTRRAGKLYKARSRLDRSQILQVNTRLKALAEIYTMHSFAPLSNLKLLLKIAEFLNAARCESV